MGRLDTALHRGAGATEGYRIALGAASVAFMSTDAKANARGETADIALVANEAQDITLEVWDPRFAPMAASTNAPMLVSGTPWMAGSLLSRERAICRERGTLFEADWQRVAEEVPAYGAHVRDKIAKLGANHPFVKTEYCLVEMGSEGGLFPAARQAQMRGDHERVRSAGPGGVYALLLDVAGGDEDAPDDPASRAREKRRDSTALTVVEVDSSTVGDVLIARPTYRVVDRRIWTNVKPTALYQTMVDLARNVWKPRYVVVDATGLGAGLASFLAAALHRDGRCEVIPFVFSLSSKSKLGWDFVGCIESGRYKEYGDDGEPETRLFWQQVENCSMTVDISAQRTLRWSVPEGKGHDDLLTSAALVGVLDGEDWRPRVFSSRVRNDFGLANKPERG